MTTVGHTLAKAEPIGETDGQFVGRAMPAPRWWRRIFSRARLDRLESSLCIARVEIERRCDAPPSRSDATRLGMPPWKPSALQLLHQAEAAYCDGNVDEGWKFLHAARRMEIYGMGPDETAAYASALRAEATKLTGWRRTAVEDIVGTTAQPDDPTLEALCEAALIRDEHYNNQGYKDRLLRGHMLALVLVIAAMLTAVLLLAYRGATPATLPQVVAIMVFGCLGATVSAALSASSGGRSSARIPEIVAANRVTFMRIFIGATSALLVQLVLQSDLAVFNDAVRRAAGTPGTAGSFVVSFAAGFSERLVRQAVEFVAGRDSSGSPS
jgi:hypothetical protein